MLTDILGFGSSVAGLLGASAAKRRAERERAAYLAQLQRQAEASYQAEMANASSALYGMAGRGGDAIAALGSRLGDSLAMSGVYNASAVGGALAGAQRDTNAAISDLASRLTADARARRDANMQRVTGMRFGAASDDLDMARGDLSNAQGGLYSFLGSLAQKNLARSGANASRTGIAQVNGTVNQGANLPGNAGLSLPSLQSLAPASFQPYQPGKYDAMRGYKAMRPLSFLGNR